MKLISFKDPLSKVFIKKKRIIRKLNKNNFIFYKYLLKKKFFNLMEEKKIIQSSYLIKKNKQLYLEHRKLENFIEANEMSSYQLFLCGCHTLNIIINSIKNDYIIKDASAWNVVFYNGKPLFLDIGSFEKWDGNNTWIGYGQFIRHFITPLLINKELKIPTSKLFINYPDGIDPSTAFDLLGFRVFKSLIGLEFVYLPNFFKSKLSKKNKINNKSNTINKSVILLILERLKKKLIKLEPKASSFWSNYTNSRDHYSSNDIEIKKIILKKFLNGRKGRLLDIGCNTGEFLEISTNNENISAHGIDFDENCINFAQKKYIDKKINFSHIDISNPPNSLGWQNIETIGYLNKNYNFYNFVIFFGIVHHLLISKRVPLENILILLSKISKEYIIFEFIDNKDKKFKEIAGINIKLYNYFSKKYFERIVIKHFNIFKKFKLKHNKNRMIYILKKKLT